MLIDILKLILNFFKAKKFENSCKNLEEELDFEQIKKKETWKDRLRRQLIIDEGLKYSIYLDTKGLATFGIGHLIKKSDPEYKILQEKAPFLFSGNLDAEDKKKLFKNIKRITVTKERVEEVFEKDFVDHIKECKKLFKDFDNFEEELKEILANMMFNMGYNKLSKFKKMIEAIKIKDYEKAAHEMVDSLWYNQVGSRAKRLVKRMKALSKAKDY